MRWNILRVHRDTDLYWSLEDDPESWFKSSGIITEWMLLLVVELDIPTPPVVKWTDHSLRRGGPSAAHTIGVSIAVIMVWSLWKSLPSALLYISLPIDLSDFLETLLEFDDYRHRSPLGRLHVVLINNCVQF